MTVGPKRHVPLDGETQVWPERLLENTPWLRRSVLLRSSRLTGNKKYIGGQRESTTPGNLSQMYDVRCHVAIVYSCHGNLGFFCRGQSSCACVALRRSVASPKLCLHSSVREEASDCYARCQFCRLWKRTSALSKTRPMIIIMAK